MPAIDVARNAPAAKRIPSRVQQQPAPRSEAASGGGYGIQRATRYKRTTAFKRAVAAATPDRASDVRSTPAGRNGYGTRRAQAFYGTDAFKNAISDARVAAFQQSPEFKGAHGAGGIFSGLLGTDTPRGKMQNADKGLMKLLGFEADTAAQQGVKGAGGPGGMRLGGRAPDQFNSAGGWPLARDGNGKIVGRWDVPRTPDELARYAQTGQPVLRAKGGATDSSGGASVAAPALAPTLFALHQVVRPYHAVMGAADAAVKGGNVLHGAERGFLHPDKSPIGSDVLGAMGMKKGLLRSALGLTGDVLLDPTTYASFGASIPAKVAAEKAAERAAAHAEQAAAHLGPREAAQESSRAYQAAYDRTFNATEGRARGVQMGVRAHVPLTNLTKHASVTLGSRVAQDARVAAGAAARQGGTKATKIPNLLYRASTHLNPDVRPPGLTQSQWNVIRHAGRVRRGQVGAGERDVINTGHAIDKAVPESQHPSFTSGLETTGPLTQEQQTVNKALQDMHSAEAQRGLVKGHVGARPTPARGGSGQAQTVLDYITAMQRHIDEGPVASRYFPHKTPAELSPKMPEYTADTSSTRTQRLQSSKTRDFPAPIHLQPVKPNAPEFSINPTHVITKRGVDSVRTVARSDFLSKVSGLGQTVTDRAVNIPAGHSLYRVSRDGLTRFDAPHLREGVDRGKLERALKAAGTPADNGDRFVILPNGVEGAVRREIATGGGGDHAFTRAYDKIMGWVKAKQTIGNPAYQGQNLTGDLFMFRQGGGTTRDLESALKVTKAATNMHGFARSPEALRGAGKTPSTTIGINGKRVPVTEVLRRFENQGLAEAGIHGADVTEMVGKRGDSHLRRFNTARETLPRYASFISGLRRGLSDKQAAAHVVQMHFDYGDLTPAERGLRRIVPFYTFAARNTKLQGRMLGRSPGRLATYQKAREESAKAANKNIWQADKQMQSYQARGAPVVLPGGTLLSPRLPLTDLNQFALDPQTELKNLTDRTSPLLKVPIELASNRDLFFNEPINANDPNTQRVSTGAKGAVPAPNVLGLGRALEALGIAHPIQGTKKGQGMIPGWSPYIPFLLRTLPQGNYAQQFLTNNADPNHGVTAALALANLLTGMKLSQQDPTKDAYGRAIDTQNRLQAEINDAKQRGDLRRAAELQHVLSALAKKTKVLRDRAGYKSGGRGAGGGSVGSGGSISAGGDIGAGGSITP